MKGLTAAALVLGGLLLASEAVAASDVFIKIDGIDGESTAQGHEKWIQAFHFSETWRGGAVATTTGGGAGGGKPTLGPLVFTQEHGASSVQLLKALLQGAHIKNATVEFVETSGEGKSLTFYTITLTDVVVAAISEKTVDGGGRVVDEVQLTYGKGHWESGTQVAEYDVATGKVTSVANTSTK
jgi:type VI secretion system secreted protein Hcp